VSDLSLAGILQALRMIPVTWYYVVLFLAFTAEGTSFPLVHIPSAVMFLASAHLIALGRISLETTVLVSAVGSAFGGFITYWVGTRMSVSGIDGAPTGLAGKALGPWASPQRVARVRRWVTRYGALLALAARWLGVLRPPALLGTGMARVRAYKVAPALLLGSLVYCGVYQYLALEVRVFTFRLLRQIDPAFILASAVGLALAWVAAVYILRRVRL